MKDENGKKFYAAIKMALRNEYDRGRLSYSVLLLSVENLTSKTVF